jgi:hypothetical protein
VSVFATLLWPQAVSNKATGTVYAATQQVPWCLWGLRKELFTLRWQVVFGFGLWR